MYISSTHITVITGLFSAIITNVAGHHIDPFTCPAQSLSARCRVFRVNDNRHAQTSASTNIESTTTKASSSAAEAKETYTATQHEDPNPKASSNPWSRGAVCRRAGREEFCAFTHATFNNGEGISLITTAARILALGSQPPLDLVNPDSDDPANKDAGPRGTVSHHPPPYRDVPIPGKGIGLVATEPIRAGRRIMTRTPAVMVDDKAFRGLRKDDQAILLVQAIVGLPEEHRNRFLNLSSSQDAVQASAESGKARMDMIYKIF